MSNGNSLNPARDPVESWNAVRASLRGSPWESLTLREAAEQTGMRWSFMWGDNTVGSFIALEWDNLKELRGFGSVKTRRLLAILQSVLAKGRLSLTTSHDAAGVGQSTFRAALPKQQATASANRVLEALGLHADVPLCLVSFSNRVKHVLSRERVETLGQLVQWFAVHDLTVGTRGLGSRSLKELGTFWSALLSRSHDVLSRFLPLASEGRGMSLPAAISHLFTRLGRSHLEVLRRRFACGQTLRQASTGVCGTRARGAQIEACFLHLLRSTLECFPAEWQLLWTAWERATPLSDCLGDALLSSGQRVIAAGAIARLIAKSPEGKATTEHHRRQFRAWFQEVRSCPDFYSQGVKLQSFLQLRGGEDMRASMLAFLSRQPGVDVVQEGRVVISRRRSPHQGRARARSSGSRRL